jgi:L-arabinokinase
VTARVAFFLTGHGFGHGVRNAALIEAIPPAVDVHIFTSLPESFFREELHRPSRLHACEIDCGCLQSSSVDVDVEATLARYAELDAGREAAIAGIASRLRALEIDLVVGDIPPLAFPIARAAGIPSLALCNFTWVDIYRPYVATRPRYRPMLERMQADYALADRRLRLWPSMAGGLPEPVEDVGLLCRPGRERRGEFAARFGFDAGKRWALVYVGNYGLEGVDWGGLARFPDWEFIGLHPLRGAPANYHLLRKDPSFRYADLTASCDLVMGKLGYSLVAECLSQAKPILFLGRSDFEEFPMLKAVVESGGWGREIPLPAFRALDIGNALRELTAADRRPLKADALPRILEKMGIAR